MAWMSDKQASVVRKRVFSIQSTIKRRKAKRFIEVPRGRDETKQLSGHQYSNPTEVSITTNSIKLCLCLCVSVCVCA